MNHTIIHLICNAHLDPVWLWEKEEGIAEVLSTFRVAVRFCRQYDRFVFCQASCDQCSADRRGGDVIIGHVQPPYSVMLSY